MTRAKAPFVDGEPVFTGVDGRRFRRCRARLAT